MGESLYTPSYEFGQCRFKQHGYEEIFCQGMKVLAWCIDPNDVKNISTIKLPTPY